ncbi:hypothetical protein RRG08_062715 [Elysia crispata]|uniref:Uncharacterized protein n=1 Tax=Elysia crispata TaxID=231223 RepID=A0AAE1ABN4_9GAST|nr:hypothetical protein RRG08_062715 [Elysia crispata]
MTGETRDLLSSRRRRWVNSDCLPDTGGKTLIPVMPLCMSVLLVSLCPTDSRCAEELNLL